MCLVLDYEVRPLISRIISGKMASFVLIIKGGPGDTLLQIEICAVISVIACLIGAYVVNLGKAG